MENIDLDDEGLGLVVGQENDAEALSDVKVGPIVELILESGNLPAVVVRVHNADCVNLKVFQDGNCHDMYLTSVMRGAGHANFQEIS